MSQHKGHRRSEIIEAGVEEMKLDTRSTHLERGRSRTGGLRDDSIAHDGPLRHDVKMESGSESKSRQEKSSPSLEKHEEVIGGDVTVKLEPGQPPKLTRSTSQRIVAGPSQLFDDKPSKTAESKSHFQLIAECTYANKHLGYTEHGSMDCDCTEEWDSFTKTNEACGDDSDCINRATKMECIGDCGCGADCQNQRFQRQQFAAVTVFQTEKKGYGLRADCDLSPNEFIYEYIGEVINEQNFRRRMVQYDEEGVKHFYFMSLTKGEFVDATKKGNLGRFCNHSCNPNCYVDKWVVGDKLRMGIFAERKIKAGEELVFNYNVDRYGANPQPCYCGEPNCTGFIGGKTQTERATKLSNTTIEALGIDDLDGWDTAVAKKPRRKKVGEDDEEYVDSVQPKSLDENGVTKVMATLMQCKEKWIAVKLLGRIQRCDDERVRNRVIKMHGYQILNSNLALWKDDANVVLQIFDILDKSPRLTRNKISDSKIESTVESLRTCDDERVASQAQYLLKEWSNLEVAYRIPRMKREAASNATPQKQASFGRRDSMRKSRSKSHSPDRSRSSSKSMDAPKGPAAPSGPRSNFSQRNPGFYAGPRPPFRPRFNALPQGWFSATDENGRTYFYDLGGKTTWERPTIAATPPPPPPKPTSNNQALEDIIKEITSAKANTPREKAVVLAAPQDIRTDPSKGDGGRKEKWRAYPEEKQKRLYENTLFPHVKHVMDKYKGKLPKDDLKRFAKEISKKLVHSDFKSKRVSDPTMISTRQEKQVKTFVKDYFDKAVIKHQEREQKRAEKRTGEGTSPSIPTIIPFPEKGSRAEKDEDSDGGEDMAMSDDEDMNEQLNVQSTTPMIPADLQSSSALLKRKRIAGEIIHDFGDEDIESPQSKRMKSETPPPPPPPPAPVDGIYPSPTTLSNEMIGDEAAASADPRCHQSNGIHDPIASSAEFHVDNTESATPRHPMIASLAGKVLVENATNPGSVLTPDSEGITSVLGDDELSDVGESERIFGAGNNRHHAVRA